MNLNDPINESQDGGDIKSVSKTSSAQDNEAGAYNRAKNRVRILKFFKLVVHFILV
jgi:hypothetical protein